MFEQLVLSNETHQVVMKCYVNNNNVIFQEITVLPGHLSLFVYNNRGSDGPLSHGLYVLSLIYFGLPGDLRLIVVAVIPDSRS